MLGIADGDGGTLGSSIGPGAGGGLGGGGTLGSSDGRTGAGALTLGSGRAAGMGVGGITVAGSVTVNGGRWLELDTGWTEGTVGAAGGRLGVVAGFVSAGVPVVAGNVVGRAVVASGTPVRAGTAPRLVASGIVPAGRLTVLAGWLLHSVGAPGGRTVPPA